MNYEEIKERLEKAESYKNIDIEKYIKDEIIEKSSQPNVYKVLATDLPEDLGFYTSSIEEKNGKTFITVKNKYCL